MFPATKRRKHESVRARATHGAGGSGATGWGKVCAAEEKKKNEHQHLKQYNVKKWRGNFLEFVNLCHRLCMSRESIGAIKHTQSGVSSHGAIRGEGVNTCGWYSPSSMQASQQISDTPASARKPATEVEQQKLSNRS